MSAPLLSDVIVIGAGLLAAPAGRLQVELPRCVSRRLHRTQTVILIRERVEHHSLVQRDVFTFDQKKGRRRRPEQDRRARRQDAGAYSMAATAFLIHRVTKRDPSAIDGAHPVD